MKLRLYPYNYDLAERFHIGEPKVSKIINFIIPKLASILLPLIYWPTREENKKNMPNSFKNLYPNCISIIDCFELKCQRPTDLTMRSSVYSQYKHHPTMKFLISCTPNGSISYISEA